MYTLSVMDNACNKGIHDIIVNVLDVVMKDRIIFPPHSQCKSKEQTRNL